MKLLGIEETEWLEWDNENPIKTYTFRELLETLQICFDKIDLRVVGMISAELSRRYPDMHIAIVLSLAQEYSTIYKIALALEQEIISEDKNIN